MIRVTNDSYYFEGYFTQAQKAGETGKNYGVFSLFDNEEYSGLLRCFDKAGVSVPLEI